MSQIKFSLGAQELVFDSSPVFPVRAPLALPTIGGQATIPLAGGGERIETVGKNARREIVLTWSSISLDELTAMRDWFDDVVSWAITPFAYHDPTGLQLSVRGPLPQDWEPQWVDYNKYTVTIKLKVVVA